MAKKSNKVTHKCSVCRESTDSPTVYRLRKLDDKNICDVCLQSIVAPVSPGLLMEFLKDGETIYESKRKEAVFEKEMAYGDNTFLGTAKLKSKTNEKVKEEKVKVLKPKEIFKHLEEFVIGQDHAKKTIAVAAYNHFKRINSESAKKSNILMLGPTGVGKTYLVTLLSDMLNLPFTIADANSVTQAGYVGGDVEDILANLYFKADKDLEKAQKGIVLIDEIDKIAHRPHPMGGRDISGRGVQEALLKIIEGGEFKVDIGSGPAKDSILFDTSNVLFIVSGSFPELAQIIGGRTMKADRNFFGGASINVPVPPKDLYAQVTNADLEKFGLIPEFIGRLPVRTVLSPLSEDDLVSIMKNTKDSVVEYYTNAMKVDGVTLKITPGALTAIAKNAILSNTGARGLQTVFEDLLLDIMFSAPSARKDQKFTITKLMVTERLVNRPSTKDKKASNKAKKVKKASTK